MKKLTDNEISELEVWAKSRSGEKLEKHEELLKKRIESDMKSGWKGKRMTKEEKEARAKLEKLKREVRS